MRHLIRQYSVFGTSALAFAIAIVPFFSITEEQACGQQAPSASAADAPATPQPLANPATPTASTPQLYPSPASAYPQNGAPNATNGSDITILRARAQALQAQLQKTPTTQADYQEQQRVYAELLDVQRQIQAIEAASGQFAAYRQARERQDAQNQGLLGTSPNVNATDDPLNPLTQAQRTNRLEQLNASGLNSDSIASRLGSGTALTESDVALLQEQKEALREQYARIQQTLRVLQPGDQILADDLRREQSTILAQLREIDAKLVGAPQTPNVAGANAPGANFTIPPANQLPNFTTSGNSIAERMQKVNQAAQLLREAGLVQLAGYATVEAPRLADPNFVETPLRPGAWSEGDGTAESRNNPFQQVGAKDIEKITKKIDELAEQVVALSQKLADVEAQLKLLTRSSVYAAPTTPGGEVYDALDELNSQQAAPYDETSNYIDANAGQNAYPETAPSQQDLEPIPGAEDIDAPEGSDEGVPEAV